MVVASGDLACGEGDSDMMGNGGMINSRLTDDHVRMSLGYRQLGISKYHHSTISDY